MYHIEFTKTSLKQLESLTKDNASTHKRVDAALTKLSQNPNHIGLKTHKVSTRRYGEHFSSRVTGDIRLFWNYHKKKIIIILAVADHSAYN